METVEPRAKLTKEALAATLTGRQYTHEITHSEEDAAKESGLLVVYGASDDLVELRGAIEEELSAYDGTEVLLGRDGEIVPSADGMERDEEEILEKYGVLEVARMRAGAAHAIRARWGEEKDGPSWTFETDLPHATFEVLEDDEVFCRGIVIDMRDVVVPAGVV
jgi:hypothetical protein